MLRLRLWANGDRARRRGTPDPGRLTAASIRERRSGSRAAPTAGARVPALALEGVHELAEDVELGRVEGLAGRLQRARRQAGPTLVARRLAGRRAGRVVVVVVRVVRRAAPPPGRAPPPTAKIGHSRRSASAIASDGRASTLVPAVLRPTSTSRAWKVSSASDAITTRSMRTPSSASVAANRSCVSGRSAAMPCRRMAIACASHGPDPHRQDAAARDLLEQQHVAARAHVDAHALDDHLDVGDALAGHGSDYPTRRAPGGSRDGPRRAPASAGGGGPGGGGGGGGARTGPGGAGHGPVRRAEPPPAGPQPRPAPRGPSRTRTRRCAPTSRRPPPTSVAAPRDANPSISWSRKQKPSTRTDGHRDELVEEPEEDERLDAGARVQHDVRAHDRGDRPGGTDRRQGGRVLHEHVRRARDQAADDVEGGEGPVPQPVLDADREDPEEEHVPEEVEPAAVQEHAREQADDRAGHPVAAVDRAPG